MIMKTEEITIETPELFEANAEANANAEAKVLVNPYNFNNKLVNEKFVSHIFKTYGLDFKPFDISLYQNAFVHKSYCHKKLLELEEGTEIVDKPEGALPLQENDNERLEFLGDSVLNPTVANYLFHRFPDEHEGFYTRVKNRLVCGEALGKFAKEMGFSEYMIISRHIEDKCNGRFSVKLLEDCFEAFMGAVYLDFNNIPKGTREYQEFSNITNTFDTGIGFYMCEKLFINIIEEHIDFSDIILRNTNYKDQIGKYYKEKFSCPVKYREIEVIDEIIQKLYTMAVLDINEEVLTIGKGYTKKKAEQEAAYNALVHFGVL